MKRPRVLPIVVILLCLLSLGAGSATGFPLAASSWRCGRRVVGEGQTARDVYELCGEPNDRAVTTDFVTIRIHPDVTVTRAVAIERWIYDRGPHQFVRSLTFRDGILVAIDEGPYGGR